MRIGAFREYPKKLLPCLLIEKRRRPRLRDSRIQHSAEQGPVIPLAFKHASRRRNKVESFSLNGMRRVFHGKITTAYSRKYRTIFLNSCMFIDSVGSGLPALFSCSFRTGQSYRFTNSIALSG